MQITLKRAHALSKAALAAADAISVETHVHLPIHAENPLKTLGQARATAVRAVARKRDLIAAAYALRALIGKAHAEFGLHNLLAERAALDAEEKLLTRFYQFAEDTSYTPEDTIQRQIDAALAREQKAERVFAHEPETIRVQLLGPPEAKGYESRLAEIRQRKRDITDSLMETDLRVKVTTSGEIDRVLLECKVVV